LKIASKIALSIMNVIFVMGPVVQADECVDCHRLKTPVIVYDWEASKHSANGVDCSVCHGDKHTSETDVQEVQLPTPQVCGECHQEKLQQFSRGKHALAWSAMNAMPTIHWQPMVLTEGMKGCGGCHKIGLKSEKDLWQLKKSGTRFGVASCDACHTRHTFAVAEARDPEACRTCHMGFDHPQWEMYSSSKHGVRHGLKQIGKLPETAVAPTCQTCHMQEGDHEVRTAWGFLAVRLPLPEDPQWREDRITILQALGLLDPQGQPTARLDLVKDADVARLDEESWQKEREKMVKTCHQCHSLNFASGELEKSDRMIREADHILAEAIRIVGDLYQEGILAKPEGYAHAFPDLLTFHDAPTEIEQTLFEMYLEHRMRAFQGAFHANPDYALWYGWSAMARDLTKIKAKATELRERRQ
jgi:hydroxylamine dehydrogenase